MDLDATLVASAALALALGLAHAMGLSGIRVGLAALVAGGGALTTAGPVWTWLHGRDGSRGPFGNSSIVVAALAVLFAAPFLFHGSNRGRLLLIGVASLAWGYALQKLDCFADGCCFGVPTGVPWRVRYEPHSAAALYYGAYHGVHPVQLYDAATAAAAALFVVFRPATERPLTIAAGLVLWLATTRLAFGPLRAELWVIESVGATFDTLALAPVALVAAASLAIAARRESIATRR